MELSELSASDKLRGLNDIHQVSEMLKSIQDNFLMSELFNMELVEVIDGDVEQALASHIVVDEVVAVGINRIVQT